MDDERALLQFCAADASLRALDEAVAPERRQLSRSAAGLREVLRAQLEQASGGGVAAAPCVPVEVGGRTFYAELRERRRGGGSHVTTEAVMAVLRALRYDAASVAGKTLEEWIEGAVAEALSGGAPASAAAASSAPTSSPATPSASASPSTSSSPSAPPPQKYVRLSAKPPAGFDAASAPQPHPEVAARLRETVASMRQTTDAAAALRKRDDARRKALKAERATHEETVAAHLAQHDPTHGLRRVQLVQGDGRAQTVYLRRKVAPPRAARPTLRSALPAIRRAVRAAREASGVGAVPTWDAVRWLTSEATLARLEAAIAEGLGALGAPKPARARVVVH